MRKLKKGLAAFLAACMIASVAPVSALAEEAIPLAEGETSVVAEVEQPAEAETPAVAEAPAETPAVTEQPAGEPEETEAPAGEPAATEQPAEEPEETEAPAETETPAGEPAAEQDPEEESGEDGILMGASAGAAYSLATSAADSETENSSLDTSTFYRIFHLDCGRKSFSVDEIKDLIDQLADNHYTHMQLAFGNDALRFLLDDMSVGNYTNDAVKNAITSGNSSYANTKSTDATTLTQSDMDAILEYATEKGIDIIPLLNTPGHMTVLVSAMQTLEVSNTSGSNMDLSNEQEVAFIQGLLQKYITYFAGKGCKFFNMGADEYSFSSLDSTGYATFVSYINAVAGMIKTAGMTPIAFNDGIYYNSDDTDFANVAAKIDRDIIVAYWCQGSGYASAATLAAKGFSLLNNNSYWYYVLGDALYDVWSQGQWGYEDSKAALQATPCTTFDTSDSTGATAIGSVMCVWCDYPQYSYEPEKVFDLLATMATSNSDYFKSADSQNQTVTDADTSITVTAPGLTSLNCNKVDNPAYSADGATVVGYNITPYVNGDPYKGSGTVAIPVPEELTNFQTLKVYDPENNQFLDNVTIKNGTVTFIAPHFSEYDLVEQSDDAGTPITVEVGKTKEVIVNGENYAGEGNNYATDDPLIATVDVTGQDYQPPKYSKVTKNPWWNGLISDNSDSPIVTSYYYLVDDQYYQLYATRSEGTRKYRYNYSLGYYKNGGEILTLITSATNSYAYSQVSSDITLYNKSTEGTPASTTITFTGVAPGTTYVTVGDTKYTITVTAEDLSNVTPLTVEFWLTNNKVSKTQSSELPEYDTTISAEQACVEQGVEIASIVPNQTWKIYSWGVGEIASYWKSTVLDSRYKQTSGWNVNQTQNGTDFTKVRYWNSEWQILNNAGEWKNVPDDAQVVAYYMQRFKVIDELTTLSVDWADTYAPDNQEGYNANQRIEGTNSDWNVNNWSALDFQVVYSGGAKNPTDDSFAVSGKTQIFHNGNSEGVGNTIGMIGAEIDPRYTITKIEILNVSNWEIKSANNEKNDYATLDINYLESNAEVVWDANDSQYADKDPVVTSVSFGDINANNENDINGVCNPNINRLDSATNATNCVLIRYYIEANPEYENLHVHYVNQDTGTEFFSYGISSVTENGAAKDTFAEKVSDNGQPIADPLKVTNTLGVDQPVYYKETDFGQIDGMPDAYASGNLFEFQSATVSEDGLDIYFYYTTTTQTIDLIADFGLPINLSSLSLDGTDIDIKDQKGNYGSVTNGVYTPSKVLQGVETLKGTYTVDETQAAALINIYPATTVYYEEGFAELGSGFNGGSKGNGTQTTEVAGKKNYNYGYDPAYERNAGPSNGTQAVSSGTTANDVATFTFTGTAVDIYTNNDTSTGVMMVQVKDSSNKTVKLLSMDTKMANGTTDATTDQAVTAANVPSVTFDLGTLGTYTVKISHVKRSNTEENTDPLKLDGFRVYNTLGKLNDDAYDSNEKNPQYFEMRDSLLGAYEVSTKTSSYADQIGDNIISQVYTNNGTTSGAILLEKAENQEAAVTDLPDLLDNGPKNEVYLQPGQSLAFTLNYDAQIGLKSLTGEPVSIEGVNDDLTSLSSATDMFYNISQGDHTIKNTGKTGILAITKIKVADKSLNSAEDLFGGQTAQTLTFALTRMGFAAAPADPVTAAAALTVNVVDEQGAVLASNELTAEGTVGESHTFPATDIAAAVPAVDGYTVDISAAADVTVPYGETQTVTFTAVQDKPEPTPEPTPEPEPQPNPGQSIISGIINTIKNTIKNIFNGIFGRRW